MSRAAAGAGGIGGGEPTRGWLAAEVAEELPGLELLCCPAAPSMPAGLTGPSPPPVEARMRALSSRVRGARAIALRSEPVPAAYRVFFRHIGLDPDLTPTPIEEALRERMLRGGFPTGGLLADVLLLALADTSVPVWALAAAPIEGPLGIRTSRAGELLGRAGADAAPLREGSLVVADRHGPLCVLFGAVAPELVPRDGCAELVLFAVRVAGVPALFAEEALWNARSALEGL